MISEAGEAQSTGKSSGPRRRVAAKGLVQCCLPSLPAPAAPILSRRRVRRRRRQIVAEHDGFGTPAKSSHGRGSGGSALPCSISWPHLRASSSRAIDLRSAPVAEQESALLALGGQATQALASDAEPSTTGADACQIIDTTTQRRAPSQLAS